MFVPVLPHFDLLAAFAIIYACLFSQNLAAHIKYYRKGAHLSPNRGIMLGAVILFALCDIHVLMFNLHHYFPVPSAVGTWGFMWMWVFYAPSQVLFGVSALSWE